MTRSVTVLTNPAAGSGHASWASAAAVTRLRERGVAVTEIEGSSAEEALDLARKAVAEGTDALVAAGGDGVVSIAWQALAQTERRSESFPEAPATTMRASSTSRSTIR